MRLSPFAFLVGTCVGLALKETFSITSPPRVPGSICLGNNSASTCVDPTDPAQCPKGSYNKAAITFTFDQYIPWSLKEDWYRAVNASAAANGADLVLLLPNQEAPEEDDNCTSMINLVGDCRREKRIPIPESELKTIAKYFKIIRTPWVVPPGLNAQIPRDGGCCGAREFMKLHAMALTDYDAVINLDTDMDIVGDLTPLFNCAASNMFLTARGSRSGVNGGMIVVKPSKALLYDMVVDLSLSHASELTGWNERGLAPSADYGQAGLQGFLYYYFHQRGPEQSDLVVGQVDPCMWTGAVYCNTAVTCKHSPLRHKIKCP